MSEQTSTISVRFPAIAKLSTKVSTLIARASERRALWELVEANDQHMLKDIGSPASRCGTRQADGSGRPESGAE